MPLLFRRILLCLAVPFCLYAAPLSAADDLGMFDPDQNYDILFEAGQKEVPILRRVRIVRTVEFSGRNFLVVIKEAGFNAKQEEAFVAIESIKAIIPSGGFILGTLPSGK